MSIYTTGINHKTTPLALREKLALETPVIPQILKEFLQLPAVNEAVVLSTCNRTEIYFSASDACSAMSWLAERQNNAGSLNCYTHQDHDAIEHLIRVASGLDSMVIGEPEIFGQIKQAYQIAIQAGAVGPEFKQLFPKVFSIAKKIRSQTEISRHPVSIACAALQLAERIFPKLTDCKILLIGAGTTIELVMTHLYKQGVRQLLIANRNLERANQIAQHFQAKIIALTDLNRYLRDADIVICATKSPIPILGKGLIEQALRFRKRKPIFMADLSVPRNIEPEVKELEDIYLYNIDDLQALIQDNLKCRHEAAKQAEAMVHTETEYYLQKLRIMKAGDMIRQFRQQFETIRDAELEKALAHWQKNPNPQTVLTYLAHNLTNKLLHKPTLKIRQALAVEQIERLLTVQDLFE